MHDIDHCPNCLSLDIKTSDAGIDIFICKRLTNGAYSNKDPALTKKIVCQYCDFVGMGTRFSNEEMALLYKDYRGKEYTELRLAVEPTYKDYLASFDEQKYIQERLATITRLVNMNIDPSTVKTLVDFGGDTGQYIPDIFPNAKKYVYDVSGVDLVQGVERFDPNKINDPIDFIMCCHTLEHVSEPNEIINNLKGLANSESLIYIEVPNFDISTYDVFHEHINYFNQKSIGILIKRNGLKVIDWSIDRQYLAVLCKLE